MLKERSTLIAILILMLVSAIAVYFYRDFQSELEQQALHAQQTLARGVALYKQDQYNEAIQVLESVGAILAEDWRVSYYIGMAQVKLKDFEAAAGSLETSVERDSMQIAPLFALGVTYFKLGNLGLSKSYFAAVLEIDPGNEEARGMMNTMAKLERIQPDGSPDG